MLMLLMGDFCLFCLRLRSTDTHFNGLHVSLRHCMGMGNIRLFIWAIMRHEDAIRIILPRINTNNHLTNYFDSAPRRPFIMPITQHRQALIYQVKPSIHQLPSPDSIRLLQSIAKHIIIPSPSHPGLRISMYKSIIASTPVTSCHSLPFSAQPTQRNILPSRPPKSLACLAAINQSINQSKKKKKSPRVPH